MGGYLVIVARIGFELGITFDGFHQSLLVVLRTSRDIWKFSSSLTHGEYF
jgi:hypothetical protein